MLVLACIRYRKFDINFVLPVFYINFQVGDLFDITHSVPLKPIGSDDDDEILNGETSGGFFDGDFPHPTPYDPWLSQRPFTANQMKAYIALMPYEHGKKNRIFD